ncbi:MAG: low affinity iron permease family protein [Bacteroidetes bacterium]|nr:MAG: low affinity iron permease family protein [Bacteroidota bacterium]
MNKQQTEIRTKNVNKKSFRYFFDKMATKVTKASGKPAAFIVACVIVVAWLVTGPLFKYSDTWQLVINTGTTIITFLMVFIIQQTQNKDTVALQIKLNELIASSEFASNRLVNVEDLTSEDLETLKKFYSRLAELAQKERDVHKSHSLDEAHLQHKKKLSLLTEQNNRKPL